MTEVCAACAAGPVGVEGHPDLLVRSLGENGLSFACRDCQALWSRTYSTHGHFVWTSSEPGGRDIGMSLPLSAPPRVPMPPARMNSAPGTADHWLAVQLSWKRARRNPR